DAFCVPVPVAEGEGDPPSLGSLLAAELTRRKHGRPETLVALGRSSAELKQLTLPPAPDDELPDMVRFQAVREFTSLADDWSLDFNPLQESPDGSRVVLAAAVSPETLAEAQKFCEPGGLTPKRLILRPFAATSLLDQRQDDGRAARLLVDLLANEVDLTVSVDGKAVFLRTARVPGDRILADPESCKPLLGEIRRTLAAVHNQLGDRRVEAVFLCGDQPAHQEIARRIEETVSLPTQTFNPLEGAPSELAGSLPRGGSRFAGLLGMLHDEASARPHAVDFLNPRRAPPPPSRARPLALAAVAATAVVLIIGWTVWKGFADLDAQIAALQLQSKNLDNLVKEAAERETQIKKIAEWADREILWLDELRELSDTLPESKELMITQLICTARSTGGEIQLQGIASKSEVAAVLADKLRNERRRVIPGVVQQNEGGGRYPWKFKSSLVVQREIAKTKRDEPKKKPAISPSAAKGK
ncbi:MAG: hypothetical protein N2C14_33710, partial [Planctomycetales bacterium]